MMRLAPFLLAIVLASCGPARVPFAVVFPSQDAFVATSTMRVRVYGAQTNTCPGLFGSASREVGIPETPLSNLEQVEPCAFRSGISLPDTGAGDRLFLVEGLDMSGRTILVGCAQGEVYGGATISVTLSTTERYPETPNPSMQTAAQRCAGGV